MALELPRTTHVDYRRFPVFSIQEFSLILNIQDQLYLDFEPVRKRLSIDICIF